MKTYKFSSLIKICLFSVIFLGFAFYFLIYRSTSSKFENEIINRQNILIRAEAENLESFFRSFGNSVVVRANQSDTSTNSENKIHTGMSIFVNQWRDSGLIGGMALTDENGIVILNHNVMGTKDVGTSLADRDYFLWAKENRKPDQYFVGKPVIGRGQATKGNYIVPVVAGVYSGDKFKGVLVSSVKLLPLSEQFLELLHPDDSSHVHLTDQEGSLLYDRLMPDAVGSSFFDRHQGFNNDALKKALSEGKSGSLKTDLIKPNTNKKEKQMVSYAPVDLGSQRWMIFMHASNLESVQSTTPIFVRFAVLLLFVIISSVLFLPGIKTRTGKNVN